MVRGNSGDSSGWAKSMGANSFRPNLRHRFAALDSPSEAQAECSLPEALQNAGPSRTSQSDCSSGWHEWRSRCSCCGTVLIPRYSHASEPRRLVQLNVSDSSFLAKLDHPSVGNREESASSMIIRDLEDFAGLSGSPWNPSQSSSYCSCLQLQGFKLCFHVPLGLSPCRTVQKRSWRTQWPS